MAMVDLRAGLLDEGAVLHARRTGGDTGHAAETRIEMPDERVGHPYSSVESPFHERDAASRRVHLRAPQKIGWTRGKTEPAVHARVDERPIGRVPIVESDSDGWASIHQQVDEKSQPE